MSNKRNRIRPPARGQAHIPAADPQPAAQPGPTTTEAPSESEACPPTPGSPEAARACLGAIKAACEAYGMDLRAVVQPVPETPYLKPEVILVPRAKG